MERDELLQRQNKVLCHLNNLPRKIMLLHGIDNVTELVLHDLSHEQCFNLKKAAYFVDNPDFNCLKGIAGFSREEAYPHADKMWEDHAAFSKHMKKSSFNNKVRGLMRCSLKKGDDAETDITHSIARDLGLENHSYVSWNMRHDNHGLFIFEKSEPQDTALDDYLANGVACLGFCPIF